MPARPIKGVASCTYRNRPPVCLRAQRLRGDLQQGMIGRGWAESDRREQVARRSARREFCMLMSKRRKAGLRHSMDVTNFPDGEPDAAQGQHLPSEPCDGNLGPAIHSAGVRRSILRSDFHSNPCGSPSYRWVGWSANTQRAYPPPRAQSRRVCIGATCYHPLEGDWTNAPLPSNWIGLLRGENFGKKIIRVSEDPTHR